MSKIVKIFLFGFLLVQIVMGQSLKQRIDDMFDEVLDLHTTGTPAEHQGHFLPASVATSGAVINYLTNFIGGSISSFPLSSSSAGITFDFSSGRPVPTTTSFGPIYSERAQTIGSGRFNIGFNFTYMNFTKIRGLPTENMRLTFTHKDVGAPGLGNSPNEFDTMDFYMHLDIRATIFAFYVTYGITDRLDVSVAVPFTNVNLKANPFAQINSYTWVSNDTANHYFGGDSLEPILTRTPPPVDDDASGLGDIALRAKYNFVRDAAIDIGLLAEYRLATGDADNFLGAGYSQLRVSLIGSKIIDNFAPHINLGYIKRFTDQERSDLEFIFGYDQKIADPFTLVIDFLGRFDLGKTPASQVFPSDPVLHYTVGSTNYTQVISLTNIPEYAHDNQIDASFGFKLNPKEALLIMGNVIVPLNSGGLRADVVPMLGIEFSM